MGIIKILVLLLVIAFGIFMIVFGGYDDSPGAQLLGLILVVVSIFGTFIGGGGNKGSH